MRARGDGFFVAADTRPYQPQGTLLGQGTGDSCAAACCRMLLFDYVIGAEDDYFASESFLRSALKTNRRGSVVARIPEVLREREMLIQYECRRELTIDDLQKSVKRFPAIALVGAKVYQDFHALIVEDVDDMLVRIRDPLPEGNGSAYSISRSLFLPAWINEDTGCGYAVVVLE